jgi:hypothetical protein
VRAVGAVRAPAVPVRDRAGRLRSHVQVSLDVETHGRDHFEVVQRQVSAHLAG